MLLRKKKGHPRAMEKMVFGLFIFLNKNRTVVASITACGSRGCGKEFDSVVTGPFLPEPEDTTGIDEMGPCHLSATLLVFFFPLLLLPQYLSPEIDHAFVDIPGSTMDSSPTVHKLSASSECQLMGRREGEQRSEGCMFAILPKPNLDSHL